MKEKYTTIKLNIEELEKADVLTDSKSVDNVYIKANSLLEDHDY